jgi:hypothetical protein
LFRNPEDPAAGDPSSETEPSIQISKVAPGPDPQNSDPTGNSGGSADIDEALGALLTALGKTENTGLKSLYDSHFKDQSKDFSKSPFWGLAKLQARQLGLISESDAMLGDANALSGVKAVYRPEESIEALKDQKDALELLAWTCCQRSQKPEFPKTKSDPNPLLLPVGRDCKDLKPADVVSGLEALTEWVTEQEK